MKFAIVFGTRPEILKFYSLIKQAEKQNIETVLIHTNQHYSAEMDKVFFDELQLPKPQYNLGIGSKNPNQQIAEMIEKIDTALSEINPDVVFVQGDTNSTFAGAFAANKRGIKVAHVEAGLRSYDREMPEEINRILTDHLSDFLFPVTQTQFNIIKSENIDTDKVTIVGNTIVDCLNDMKKSLSGNRADILEKYKLEDKKFYFLTLHRPSNVDDKNVFQKILENLDLISKENQVDIIFPAHPRTLDRIKKFQLEIPESLKVIPPTPYKDCLSFMIESEVILTDSGGIQEEACILGKPCLTLRENTERPETLQVKSNILVGNSYDRIKSALEYFSKESQGWENPFGDGKTAERIIQRVVKN